MNACPLCGTEADAGQSFCRHCGGSLETDVREPPEAGSPPSGAHASAEMTGRSCPYCRFPLKQGAPITECTTCHTVHHAECWEENGGCSITGCTGGPTLATQVHAPAPPVPTAAGTPASAPAPQASPAASPQIRAPGQMPIALAAALAAVVAILGAAAALALSSGGGGRPSASTPAPVATQTTQATLSASGETAATTSGDTQTQATETNYAQTEAVSSQGATQSATPSNESQTESPLGAVNEHWHDIQSGNYQGAWADETPSLRGDESSWVHGQEAAGIESIDYRFKEASRSGSSATVDIEELRTVSRQNGCQSWTGTYGLTEEGGSWEISDASTLQSHSC